MKKDSLRQHVLSRTGRLYELYMVSNALKEAGVPHFTGEEPATVPTLAMPAAPTTGPGIFCSVVVFEGVLDDANKILDSLPVEKKINPGIWDFLPKQRSKRPWKALAIAILLLSLILTVMSLVMRNL